MHRQTKATAIPAAVKKEVWQRDFCRCVLCHSINAGPHCHFVRRSQGGLGIPENIWTGCQICHDEFDSEATDGPMHERLREYFRTLYPDWDEKNLKYRKDGPNAK